MLLAVPICLCGDCDAKVHKSHTERQMIEDDTTATAKGAPQGDYQMV